MTNPLLCFEILIFLFPSEHFIELSVCLLLTLLLFFVGLVKVNYWHWSAFQMLTMRNGLSLYPMCLPGALQPAQLTQMAKDFYEGNGTDVTGMSFNPETSTSSLFNIPNQNTNPGQLTAIDLSSALSSETSFGRESAIEGHLRPLQLRTSSRVSLRV